MSEIYTREQIKKSGILSPGIIGGEKVYFLSTVKSQFFFKHDFESAGYAKDDKGIFIKLNLEDVIEARYLYLLNNLEEEKNEAICDEIKKIQDNLVSQANELIEIISKNQERLNPDSIWNKMLKQLSTKYIEFENNISLKKAEEFFIQFPDALWIRDRLKSAVEKNNYEFLSSLFDKEMPVLASFKNGDDVDLTALINTIGANHIEDTLKNFDEKGAIWFKAKAVVEKKYFPQ